MKKLTICSGVVFITVFLACYFLLPVGPEVTEAAKVCFGAVLGFLGVFFTWLFVHPKSKI